jgi:hypothetical protein
MMVAAVVAATRDVSVEFSLPQLSRANPAKILGAAHNLSPQ